MPSSVLHDQIPHSLLFPDQHFISFLLVSLVVLALFIFSLLDRTSFPPSHEVPLLGYSRLQKVIVVISLRLIGTLSPLMSPSLRTHHSFPPLLSLFLFLKSCPFPLSPHLMLCPLDHFRFIIVALVSLFLSLFLRHLLTHFLSLRLHLPRLCLLLMTYPLLFERLATGNVDEMAALHSNDTWDLVVLPSGKSTVGCRWVYAVKVGPDGQIASVRLLLSMAAMCSWPLYQLDIKNAFLHVILLRKFIWSNLLCIYLVVYVDDIVITGSDQDARSSLCGPFPKEVCFNILEETGYVRLLNRRHTYGSECQTCTRTGGAFRRPREISTARRYTRPRCIVREQRSYSSCCYTDADWLAHPQIDVPLRELRFGKDETDETHLYGLNVLFVVWDNTLQCDSCLQSNHLQCLNSSLKHMQHGKRLCSSCIKEHDSSTSQLVQESGRNKAKKQVEGSDTREIYLLLRSSVTFREARVHIVNSGSACNDGFAEGNLLSCSVGMNSEKNLETLGLKSSYGRKCSYGCAVTAASKTLNMEGSDSQAKDKSSKVFVDSLTQAKVTTPLLTFSRRSKRKRDVDSTNAERKFLVGQKSSLITKLNDSSYGIPCLSEATSQKGFSVAHQQFEATRGGSQHQYEAFILSHS
ncbi:hypothetical protein CK203_105147 [Vitis vinifera]|uniref:Reverse transcriptase Ty1/copia-type domain-containing protein n=1 Tax=Vitis vinifera TaxID=29760 RepID=A0A438EDZ6_VITVI|nr:hypothetical protein CK203_105147 [Vitis vinifera]